MYEYAIKINLTDSAKAEIYAISDAITEYIVSNITVVGELAAYLAGPVDPIAIITTNPVTGMAEVNKIDVVWDMIECDVPNVVEVYEKYSLAKGLIRVTDRRSKPHKHLSGDSEWSLTMIQGIAPGELKFYEVNEGATLNEREFVEDLTKLRCIETVATGPGDVISINQNQWHGWIGEVDTTSYKEHKHVISVFSLRNTPSRENAELLISKLESIS